MDRDEPREQVEEHLAAVRDWVRRSFLDGELSADEATYRLLVLSVPRAVWLPPTESPAGG